MTAAVHEWLDASYFSLRDVHAASLPLALWQWHLERLPLCQGVSIPLLPVFATIRSDPHHIAFVTDGSWFSSHRCGGTFAVACVETHTWAVYVVHVPLDHSYAVQVYTLWVLYPCQEHDLSLSLCLLHHCTQRKGGC